MQFERMIAIGALQAYIPTQTLYQCPGCRDWHEEEEQAQECCQPDIRQSDTEKCPECGRHHHDTLSAALCCHDEEYWQDLLADDPLVAGPGVALTAEEKAAQMVLL
ncbi:hypothetical protein LH435_13645 [Laribacter hongkongensis]|uniref:hypothetical protein n=1 Tax=Laribacter hongkongensis TaxID=168471 RepID=UPI001EFDA173|nr:hypothetical protein [Laribacter hongkongensis]MCG8995587.1 hypothetical protein [Laribacter hongkongensis]MCG9009319.1 hypothetical protein [Laribacter hongkongensis]MCG9022654.1 hypothetical protein [Laribacter hongkongensis]MCG9045605.1 hypothetical protein [Laribacter hongkongensis]MCG9075031.1 hypothetical protein [Laribacter hongkongensis]